MYYNLTNFSAYVNEAVTTRPCSNPPRDPTKTTSNLGVLKAASEMPINRKCDTKRPPLSLSEQYCNVFTGVLESLKKGH